MRLRRGFFLMELVIGFAILLVAISLAAAVFSQSRIGEQKLLQLRNGLRLQQNAAWQMLINGKPSAESAELRIQTIRLNQTPTGYQWISISPKTQAPMNVPIFVLAPVPSKSAGGQ